MKRSVKTIIILTFFLLSLACLLCACDASGTAHKHTLTHVASVAPTCTTDGTKEYWQCIKENKVFGKINYVGCKEKFADADGKHPVSDDDLVIPALKHPEEYEAEITPSTCSETGTKTFRCTLCNEVTRTETLPLAEHKPVVVDGIAPTCTKTGQSSYVCCENCGIALQAPTVIPALGHEINAATVQWRWEDETLAIMSFTCKHSGCGEVLERSATRIYVSDEVAATCTSAGSKTYRAVYEGDNTVILGTEYTVKIGVLPHTEVVDQGYPATCTQSGLTDGIHCSSCNRTLTAQSVIPALGHKEVTDFRVEPTCTDGGLSEGKHCSVCQEILIPQTTLPARGHTEVVVPRQEPTCTEDGYTEGRRCSVCKKLLSGCELLPRLGHAVTQLEYVEPTCFADGHEAGEYCSVCNTYVSGGATIPAYNHDFSGDAVLCKYGCQTVNPQFTAIGSVEDFELLRNAPDKPYYLSGDINLSGQTWNSLPEFSGILDGCGHKVYNFMLSATSVGKDFGFMCKNLGTVRNLKLSDFTVSVSVDKSCGVGALAGSNSGLIDNCAIEECVGTYMSTDTYITVNFGALVGYNGGTISDCQANAQVTVSSSFIAVQWDSHSDKLNFGMIAGGNGGVMTDSVAKGSVTASAYRETSSYSVTYYANIGGLVGEQLTAGSIENCNAEVSVSLSGTAGKKTTGYGKAGGLVALNYGKIVSSYTLAGATVQSGGTQEMLTGGFVGRNETSGSIDSCYSFATAIADGGYSQLGGFVGHNGGTVRSCFSSGTVNGKTSNGRVGGFCGCNDANGTLYKNYCISAVESNCQANYFVQLNEGTVSKNYYLNSSTVMYKGVLYEQTNENNADALAYDKLFSQDFLIGTLGWNESGWIIVIDDSPMLKTEFLNGHNFKTKKYEATCENDGFTVYICADCRKVVIYDYIEKLGHDWQYQFDSEPTCTIEGFTQEKCLRCNAERKTNVTPALGHLHDTIISDEHKPTCTKEGFYVYFCERCNNTYNGETLAATGHTEVVKEHLNEATCIEEGTDLVYCSVCGDEYTVVVPLSGHTFVNMPAEERVHYLDENSEIVAKDGKTAGRECSVCGYVRSGRVIAPAHTWVETEHVDATCTADGYTKYECSECKRIGYSGEQAFKTEIFAKLPHTDLNQNYRCDDCDAWIFDEYDETYFMEIGTLDDLLNICDDLSGYYKLTADIDLGYKYFAPIGTKQRPFTGFFFGNGHKIRNLAYNADTDGLMGGLFGYNNGIILDLTVENFSVRATKTTNNAECVAGAIAAYNHGTIKDCKLIGSTYVDIVMTSVVNNNGNKAQAHNFIVGGIAAVNDGNGTGKVEGCSVAGSITTYIVAYSSVRADKTMDAVLSNFRKICSEEILHVSFGGVIGRNQGMLSNCNVTANVTVNRTAIATLWEAVGQSYATLQLYGGSLVGINVGSIADCNAVVAKYVALSSKEVKESIEKKLDGNTTVMGKFYGNVLTFVNKVLNEICAGKLYTVQAKIINHTEGVSSEIEGIVGETVGTVTNVNS